MAEDVGILCRGSKKNERIAELSHAYGFYVGALGSEQRLGLELNLPRIKAQGRIEAGRYDASNEQEVYQLWLAAYGDKKEAERMRLESMKATVRAETEAARLNRANK